VSEKKKEEKDFGEKWLCEECYEHERKVWKELVEAERYELIMRGEWEILDKYF